MTKHMYSLILPPSNTVSLAKANAFLEDWAAENEAWVGDPSSAELRRGVADPPSGGTVIWQGSLRFHPIPIARDELQANLNVRLQNNFSWFVVPYHVCEHDDVPRGGCSWDVIYYWPDLVTIPDDVEELAPDPSSVDQIIQVSTL